MPSTFPELHPCDNEKLRRIASELGAPGVESMQRFQLIQHIVEASGRDQGVLYGSGTLEIHSEGFGFLRKASNNFLAGGDDIYVSQSQIRRFSLGTGDTVIGQMRPPKEGERYPALLRVESVNADTPNSESASFESLTAIYPDDRIDLDGDPDLEAIDMAAPIGLGQRGLLVAQPRTGRVALLRKLANRLAKHDDLTATVFLVGERPEEIHEWGKTTHTEVISTPFDEPPGRHVQVADMVFARARRMAERGEDVVLIVDSLTRLLRFSQADRPSTGRDVLGIEAAAIHDLRRYMGAARAFEEGGSLTVIGVVSDPEGRMGAALLEDLQDVVNWRLTLTRVIADNEITPPIDIHQSGTLREERMIQSDDEKARRETWRSEQQGDAVEDARKLIAFCASNPATVESSSDGA